MESILEELCIHNLTVTSYHCSSLPEYAPLSNGDHRCFPVDPDSCARSLQTRLVVSSNGRGIVCQRQILFHSLVAQRKKLYCAWRFDASTIASLQCGVSDLADALDTSGSVTTWPIDAVASAVRSFCEQQRIRTRCVALVLDHATPQALSWFLDHVCPAWGTLVYVLPSPTDASRVRTLLADKIPHTETLPVVTLESSNEPLPHGVDADFTEIQNTRCMQYWVPHLAASVLRVDVASIDDSYLRKYFKATGYRPVMLRMFCEVMRRSGRDSYEAYHVAVKEGDEVLSMEGTLDVQIQRLWTLLATTATASSPSAAAKLEDDLLAITVLPYCFPAYLLSDAGVRLLDNCGVASLERRKNASSALTVVHMCTWISDALYRVTTTDQRQKGIKRALQRFQELDELVAASGLGDCATFRLHDQISLGGHRTSNPASTKAVHAQHRDVVSIHIDGGVFATPATSMTPRTARGYDTTGVAESWLRHRSYVTHFTTAIVIRNRWFFPEFPDALPAQSCPPIQRLFEELVFGIPPLPEDESTWTTTLASLFLQYAEHYRNKSDSLNAAAASERALCIYLYFIDTAASAATAKYALHLSKGPDQEKDARRRSVPSMLGRRASSHRSADSGTEGELRSVQSGIGQSFVRKMSRLTQMTHESAQTSGTELGPDTQQAYAHTFALLLLGVEGLYRRIAADYATANITGIACPLLDRGIASLELLNMNRRDTPARAITHFRRGQKELLLSRLEKRRGEVIQHAPEAQQDEGDLKLKALVRADVEERHHLRNASDQMKECLQVLRMNQCHKLLSSVIEECHSVIALHYLSEVNDKDAADSAQRAVETSDITAEVATDSQTSKTSHAPSLHRRLPESVKWARKNIRAFLRAIAANDYALVNEMLDRSPHIACLGVVGDADPENVDAPLIVCAACGSLTDDVLRVSFPEPTLEPHLQLFTTLSKSDIAAHHGNSWNKSPVPYQLPLLVLLLTMSRTNETLMAEGGILFRRLMESCMLNPLCCSPHDMKSALHIATDRSLGDVAQYLLQHPAVDPLVGAPYVLSVERVGLRTMPDVKQLPCALTCPLMYACEKPDQDCTMLLTLLMGSKDPEFTFNATQYTIMERVVREQNSFELMRRLIGHTGPFARHAQALLVSPKLCSETREAVGQQCKKETVLWGLANVQDPNVLLGLCSVVAMWGEDGATRLLDLVVSLLSKQDWTLGSEIMRRFPDCVPEEKIPYDLQRELKRWNMNHDLSG
ncbi:Hypothetical protein, putative [Bodo saltans]|uniref:Uncharacterized protein n=1 Tax=Bodo saltans TaxID=75058 RepID=A0A0S4KK94_BODSA|nr:Hypothetical protein, putative [Bodo saltans]|eukprot:CUI14749.1 Hypothetical protein, putative [Bodo saltans]